VVVADGHIAAEGALMPFTIFEHDRMRRILSKAWPVALLLAMAAMVLILFVCAFRDGFALLVGFRGMK
jgi:hypothetical protein